MKSRLKGIWKLAGDFELMDVSNGFFMVRFDIKDDRTKVIDDGPWMIFDHYLAARRLSADFNPATAKINKTMVWIRIPSPNIVFYNKGYYR